MINLAVSCLAAAVAMACQDGGSQAAQGQLPAVESAPASSGSAAYRAQPIASARQEVAPAAQSRDTFPWTAYLGNQTRATDWARTVRGPAQLARLPFDSIVAAVRALPPGVAAIVNVGGLHARDGDLMTEFFETVTADAGRSWRDTVASRARRIASAAGSDTPIIWQLGNEINARGVGRVARGRRGVADADAARPNDPSIVGMYVEMYAAPTIEGLRSAGLAPQHSRIALGSIANFANPRAYPWLDALLSYRIEGTVSRSLRGTRVADLVDVVAVHYAATAGGARWEQQLDALWNKWSGNGRVRAVWATEELGADRANDDLGAATAIMATSRWLSWVTRHGTTPEQVRWSLFGSGGGRAGSRGTDGMALLVRHLGREPVSARALQNLGENREGYLLTARSGARVVSLFPAERRSAATVREVSVPGPVPAGLTAYVVGQGQIREVPASVRATSGGAVVTFASPVTLAKQSVLLLSLR